MCNHSASTYDAIRADTNARQHNGTGANHAARPNINTSTQDRTWCNMNPVGQATFMIHRCPVVNDASRTNIRPGSNDRTGQNLRSSAKHHPLGYKSMGMNETW